MSTTTYRCYRFRCYVGPVHVAHYAAQARAAGLLNVGEGTEHVYGITPPIAFDPEYPDLAPLRQQIGEWVYGGPVAAVWRDVEILA